MKAKALNGEQFQYTNKNTGEVRQAFNLWYVIEGVPYSFKMGCFNEDQIAKAKAAIVAESFQLDLQPDRNCSPVFRIK